MKKLLFFIPLVLFLAAAAGDHIVGGWQVHASPGWEDMLIPVSSANTLGVAGDPEWGAFPSGSATNAFLFDKASDECVEGSGQFSHRYKEGTAIYCHVHWSPTTTATDNVVWQIDYTLAGMSETFGASSQLYAQDPGDGIANKHQIVGFSSIACSSCTISTIVNLKLCRDADSTNATDDMDSDVAGHYVDCHYQVDTLGSRSALAK